jgi:hypothetical protein
MRIEIIENRACYSGFDERRVSTPTSTGKTNVRGLADSASRRSRRTKVRRKPVTPEYATWRAIMARGCCRRWRCFINFRRDVGKRPAWDCLLVRRDVTREFAPDNCRWQLARWHLSPRAR